MSFFAIWKKLKSLSLTRQLIFGVSLSVFLGVALFLLFRLGTKDMTLLYRDLDLRDSSSIVSKLQGMGGSYKVRGGVSDIEVVSEEAPQIRMKLAEAGLPNGGVVGYDIFDKTDVLGTTTFIQNVNLLRALEGELSRTIQTLKDVASARVHIVIPKRELFVRDQQKPSAAVVVKISGGRKLASAQVHSIRYLLSSSVPGLRVESVSVLNDQGVLLALSTDKENSHMPVAAEEMRVVYETRLVCMTESLLERSVGEGRVRAEVSAGINMDRITEHSEKFDGDNPVVHSVQSTTDTNRSSSKEVEGASSIQTELPNMEQKTSGVGGSASESQKSEDTTNYEISKVVKTAVKEMEGIKRLSVAVLIDGRYVKDATGQKVYQKRSIKEMKEITCLTKAIIGYQKDRGDVVDVVNLKFTQNSLEGDVSHTSSHQVLSPKQNYKLFEMGILGLVALGFLIFGLRPFVNSMRGYKKEGRALGDAQMKAPQGHNFLLLSMMLKVAENIKIRELGAETLINSTKKGGFSLQKRRSWSVQKVQPLPYVFG
jgi:flagellar M-ring protein FliF